MQKYPVTDTSQNILVAPLHWGLGHATRCIPIIKNLLKNCKKVVLASDGAALELLKKEFPDLPAETLPPYDISYEGTSMIWNMLKQVPQLLQAIAHEQKVTAAICQKYNIDTIISDNRYGVRSDQIYSIIICHQINIQHRNFLAAVTATQVNRYWINQFDECWIPDHEPPHSLAGIMSYPEGIHNSSYIGPLSRMQKIDVPIKRKYLVVLSGPEPSRTYLEDILIKKLSKKDFLLVRGILSEDEIPDDRIINFLTANKLNREICASEIIICRSGYSSIMDLVALKKKAILIPTPGQPEQEYLGEYLQKREGDLFTLLLESEIGNFRF